MSGGFDPDPAYRASPLVAWSAIGACLTAGTILSTSQGTGVRLGRGRFSMSLWGAGAAAFTITSEGATISVPGDNLATPC